MVDYAVIAQRAKNSDGYALIPAHPDMETCPPVISRRELAQHALELVPCDGHDVLVRQVQP